MPKDMKTALIVDDEEALREIISEVLALLEINSIIAEDGFQAVEAVREHKDKIDLFLIDLYMPNMSGEETFKKLDELAPNRPVIFMSGYDRDSSTMPKVLNKNQKFLKKPFGIVDLKNLIESMR